MTTLLQQEIPCGKEWRMKIKKKQLWPNAHHFHTGASHSGWSGLRGGWLDRPFWGRSESHWTLPGLRISYSMMFSTYCSFTSEVNCINSIVFVVLLLWTKTKFVCESSTIESSGRMSNVVVDKLWVHVRRNQYTNIPRRLTIRIVQRKAMSNAEADVFSTDLPLVIAVVPLMRRFIVHAQYYIRLKKVALDVWRSLK